MVGIGGRIVYRQAFGLRSITPRQASMTVDTIFDLASLTKVIVTTTAIMQLAERGLIDLDKPVAAYWPAFAGGGKGAITIRELLTHYSALPPDLPAGGWSGYGEAMAKIESIAPVKTPGKFVYSDIDFAALGEIVRRVSGLSLDAYARRHIFAPLGMRDTMFTPPPALLDRIAPADIENGVLRWGSVQDPMAFHMGEVAGHAGLFGTADDLAKFAEMLLAGGSAQGHRILLASLRRRHDPAAKPPRPGRHSRLWLGHRFGLCDGVRTGLLAAVLRPYRLHRHGDLDRPGEPELHDRPDQSPASRCDR